MENIEYAYDRCQAVGKPILAKGLNLTPYGIHQALRLGASYALCHDPAWQQKFEPGVAWMELPSSMSGMGALTMSTSSMPATLVPVRTPRICGITSGDSTHDDLVLTSWFKLARSEPFRISNPVPT